MAATCYFSGGDNSSPDGKTYVPCNTTAVAEGKHSACCAPGDLCLTNGMCKGSTNDQWNWNWRIGCTDKSFNDPSCPNYCRGVDFDNKAHLIFQCQDDQTWCCATGNVDRMARDYNFTCCNNPNLAFEAGPAVVANKAEVSLRIATLSSTTAESTTTSASSSESSSVTSSMTNGGLTTTGISTISPQTATQASIAPTSAAATKSGPSPIAVGVGVGVPLGVLAIAGLCFLFWRLGRRANPPAYAHYQRDEYPITGHYSQTPSSTQVASMVYSHELDGQMKSELGPVPLPAELASPPPTIYKKG